MLKSENKTKPTLPTPTQQNTQKQTKNPNKRTCQAFLVLLLTELLCFEGSSEDQTIPMLVTGLKGLKVIDVSCGSGDAQTLAVTENGW